MRTVKPRVGAKAGVWNLGESSPREEEGGFAKDRRHLLNVRDFAHDAFGAQRRAGERAAASPPADRC